MKRTISGIFGLFISATLLIVLSGCVSVDVKDSKSPIPVDGPTVKVSEHVPAGSGLVPYVTGMKGDLALEKIKEYGLTASIEDYGSLRRTVEEPSDWTIVSQPEPGTQLKRGHAIRLFAMNLDDTFDFLGGIDSLKKMKLFDGYRVLPNLRGMTLDKAKEKLDSMGLREYADDASPEDRSIYFDSNWVVVEQDDPSGSLVESGRTIMLNVLKPGEKLGPSGEKRQISWQEGQWYGKVTANQKDREMFSSNMGYVQVDGVDLELDLIDTLDDSCKVKDLDEIAIAEKLKLLPIGTEVRVVQTQQYKVVIHIVSTDDLTKPLENSVQNKLIKTGYWVPHSTGSRNPDLGSDPTGDFRLDADGYYQGLTYQYLQILVASANEARDMRTGGMNNCYLVAKAYVKYMEKLEAEMEARQRKFEKTHPWLFGGWGTGGSCADGSRDGDGDGICNEG